MAAELNPTNYINRELSWIEFNRRVLDEARDLRHPLLERVKFLAIFATNLDEFFMIRVSSLRELRSGASTDASPDGLTPEQTLEALAEQLPPLLADHAAIWHDVLLPELKLHGVYVLDYNELNESQRHQAEQYFSRELHPVLTPLAVDPGHPFPHISNLSLSLAVIIREESGQEKLARVKVPPNLPRLVQLNECVEKENGDANHLTLVWLDQIIAANVGALFSGIAVQSTYPFRVTRDTDIEIQEDEASDLLASIENQVADRKWGQPVRLEVDQAMPAALRNALLVNLSLLPSDVHDISGTLNLADLMELMRLPLPALKDAQLNAHVPMAFASIGNIFDIVRRGDQVVFHPFDSFNPVVDFIRSATDDPLVMAIKITLYRVGQNSPVVQALIHAANKGKQVAVMVELKARFDEENNIHWARALEDAGAHVVYGIANVKVHSKIALVVRKEPEGIRRYMHLSTGNYNAGTAKIYTDIGYFTCDEGIGQDATDVFNLLTGYSRQEKFRKLLVAPVSLRARIMNMIEREIEQHEAHGNGRLIFKCNALIDPDIIALLYRASRAGVQVDMLVRGICCLVPGIPGTSERIRVVSIVGRFLEHSRVYYFNNGGAPEMYCGSADLMERNLDRRVEILFPVADPVCMAQIKSRVLDLGLADNSKARELQLDHSYRRVQVAPGQPLIDSQASQLKMAP